MSSNGAFATLLGGGIDSKPRILYRSPVLCVAAASSKEILPIVASIGEGLEQGNIRYYLSAGTGRFERPSWGFGSRRVIPKSPRTDRSLVEGMLYCREEREAFVEREIRAVESWYVNADGAPRCLVMELLGSPSRDDVAFYQACRLRLRKEVTALRSMVVLRHDAPAEFDNCEMPANRQADEILLTLLLSGGYVWAPEFERWSTLRGWEQELIVALTSTRESEHSRLYTYAGSCQRSQAWAAYRVAGQMVVTELAAMVVSVQTEPSIATAALVENPELALEAFSRFGCAEAANGRRCISLYGRNLFRNGWKRRWTGISKRAAATFSLTAIVADRKRISSAAAGALLNLAERFEVDTDVRSLLAYSLGQLLAKDTSPQSWAASVRCFEYVRACLRAKVAMNPETEGSLIAASYNGAALVYYRAGDHRGAVAAELAALDALTAPGVLEKGHLYEQQVLLLTNLAKVHSAKKESRKEALACYRQAWHIATSAESLAGMAYVAADLVKSLIGVGEHAEAETVTKELLRQYDAVANASENFERAVVAAHWTLADVNLAKGAVQVAADWYADGVRCIQRAVPDVIDRIIQNLRQQPEMPSVSVMGILEKELTAHRAIAADLRALMDLLEEREEVD